MIKNNTQNTIPKTQYSKHKQWLFVDRKDNKSKAINIKGENVCL